MNRRRHVVPADVFAALATGRGGASAVAVLAAGQRSKRILIHRAVLDCSGTANPEFHRELVRGYDLLGTVQRSSPAGADAVERVTAYPSVTRWATATLRALVRRDVPLPDPGYPAVVAVAAAVRAGTKIEAPVRARSGLVVLPTLGAARVAPADYHGGAMVAGSRDGVRVEASGTAVPIHSDLRRSSHEWAGIHRLRLSASGLCLTVMIDDVDPYHFPERGDVRRLTAAEVARWRTALKLAWSLLVRHDRASAAEVAAMLSVLVPLTTASGRQASATSRDAFGAVALSEPLDAASLAVTLIHEVQHAKLGALLDLVPMLDDAGDAVWYAPWRDDPRPLSGLLQGAYAHLGVVRFWRTRRWSEKEAMAALSAHVAFAWWRDQTWEVVQTLLASGALTAAGHTFVKGMAATLERWRHEPVPGEAFERARASARRHRRVWELRQAHRDGVESASD